jgi:dihydroorotate dehydrogenase electron transfer subunit
MSPPSLSPGPGGPRRVRIAERREVAPGHVELLVEDAALARSARAGQFAHVLTPGTLRRPISFSRVDGDRLGLLFRVVGAGTAWLAERRPGEVLDLLAPLGRGFVPPPPGMPLCLVGGGIGIPPLYLAWQQYGHDRPVTVILGARSAAQVVMEDDFRAAGVPVTVTTEDGTRGEAGRVTGPLARWLAREPHGVVWACGPTGMLAAVAAQVPDPRRAWLALEQRMGCGVGACLACVVPGGAGGPPWLRVCSDGPVFRADAVRLAGVEDRDAPA